jgi:hypothetical protein
MHLKHLRHFTCKYILLLLLLLLLPPAVLVPVCLQEAGGCVG